MLNIIPNNPNNNVLPSETIKALEQLSLILYGVHMQMKADGFEIVSGKVCKVEKPHEEDARTII